MSTICRLCLQKEDSILKDNIFDLHLSDTFYWIYGVEVDVDDPYSKLICKRCQNITNYIVRVRKQFQTNQYILKEKRCPLDYDVDLGCMTKDVGTTTEHDDTTNKILISFDTLAKLNQPFVNVRKLEHTDVQKEYQRISKCSFRKRKRFQKNKGNSKGNGAPGCFSAENISNTYLSSRIEATQTRSGGQSLHNDFLGGVQIKPEPTEFPNETVSVESADAASNTDSEARSRPVLISRATNTADRNNAVADENITSISTNTLQQLFSPTVNVLRLEDGDIGEKYEKVDDVTYRLMPPLLESQVEEEDTKRLSYMDYYYKIPTTALKELIIERHNELSSDQNSIAINNCKEKEVSLFETNHVLRVEHCKQCNLTFKTKDMLTIHCHFRHKKQKGKSVPGSKPRKRRKRLAYSKPKRCKKNSMPQLVDVQGQKMGVVESKAAVGSQPKKITDLFSSFGESKLSNKQLWLEDTPTGRRVVADKNKEQPPPKICPEPEKKAATRESQGYARKNRPNILRTKVTATPASSTILKKLPSPNRGVSVLKTLLLDKERINNSRPITLAALKSTGGVPIRKDAAVRTAGSVQVDVAQPSTSKGLPATDRLISRSAGNSLAPKVVVTNQNTKYIDPVTAGKDAARFAGNRSVRSTVCPTRTGPVAGCEASTSKSIGKPKFANKASGAKDASRGAPKLYPAATCSTSSSYVQPEIVWFPDLTDSGTVEVEEVTSDEESPDSGNGVYVGAMSSALNTPVRETLDGGTTMFIAQRLCDLKQTRVELESMKKVRTVLQREIHTATEVDTKYGFIMNLLAN